MRTKQSWPRQRVPAPGNRGAVCASFGPLLSRGFFEPRRMSGGRGGLERSPQLGMNGFLPKTLPRSHSCPSLLQSKGRKRQQTCAGASSGVSVGAIEGLWALPGGFRSSIMYIRPAEDDLMMFNCSVSGLRLHFVPCASEQTPHLARAHPLTGINDWELI